MTNRREFCKNLFAASMVPAIPSAWSKIFYGMDFGKDASSSVLIRSGHYSPLPGVKCQGAWFHEFVSIPYREVFHALLGYCDPAKVDLEGGRCSPKGLNLSAKGIPNKSRKEEKLDKFRWLWFEEANDFENYSKKGDKGE